MSIFTGPTLGPAKCLKSLALRKACLEKRALSKACVFDLARKYVQRYHTGPNCSLARYPGYPGVVQKRLEP